MTDTGAIALVIILFVNSLFILGLLLALWMIQRKTAEMATRIEPLAKDAATTLARVERLAEDLEGRTRQVLERTTALVESVSKRVDTTTALAEETISQPLIGAASVMAGISRGLQTYREQADEKGSEL